MYKIVIGILIIYLGSTIKVISQEDATRFFDLETRPSISVLYDQRYKRHIKPIALPFNIFDQKITRRNINIAQHVQQKENEVNYLVKLYESRISQQQNRISSNYKQDLATQRKEEKGVNLEANQNYNYRPYGWQNNFYEASRRWQPSFYRSFRSEQLRTNGYLFN